MKTILVPLKPAAWEIITWWSYVFMQCPPYTTVLLFFSLCRLIMAVYLSCVPDISTDTLHGCSVAAQPFLCFVTVHLLWNVTSGSIALGSPALHCWRQLCTRAKMSDYSKQVFDDFARHLPGTTVKYTWEVRI